MYMSKHQKSEKHQLIMINLKRLLLVITFFSISIRFIQGDEIIYGQIKFRMN